MGFVRLLLNIIWVLCGGIWLALAFVLAGVVACLLIVTIPFGVASFRMANYALWPFGRAVVAVPGHNQAASAVLNVLWFVFCGWWLVVVHLITAIAQALTLVGIVVAIANIKMIPVSLTPFGKRVVSRDSLAPEERPLHSL